LEAVVKKDEMTYAQAMARLEAIVKRLESGEISVDELSASVKEGVRLVTWCRKKLRMTQEDVETALKGLETPDGEANEPTAAAPKPVASPDAGAEDVDPFA
jgi:exodeoxyribonuclease VII small subunit